MINPRQKMLLHIYKNAAALPDPTYRQILRSAAGVASAADRALSQSGFERAMAALETTLFTRVAAGQVPDPVGRVKWIGRPTYWRDRLPRASGLNSRQLHQIRQKWTRLREFLLDAMCTEDYLAGIVNRACGRPVELHNLTSAQAAHVLNALTETLSRSIAHQPQEPVPF